MRKRVICGVLFALLLILAPTTAFAADAKASSRIMSYSAELRVGSDKELNIYFSVTTSSIMDIIGASQIDIQRYNGSRWVTECTLTVEDEPKMQTSDAVRHSAIIAYEPNYSSSNYRAIVTVYAKDSFGSSTAKTTSGTVTTYVLDTKTIGYANLYSPISLKDK